MLTNNNPFISIIVRTKDRPKLLKRALQSIFAQTYRPIEVVLVNDGGCDLDIDEIKSILKDISLNYIRLEKNTGRAHAGNVGLENAKGDYIGFLDDDDEFYPEHVETLASFLINESNFSGVYANSEIIERQYDEDGNILQEKNKGVFRSLNFNYQVLLFENYITLMSCLFVKDMLKQTGGIDESFEIFEDWDLLIRLTSIKPLYHLITVTTKYIQWSKIHQIAFVDWPEAKDFYLKVIGKNLDKFTPDTIYNYFTYKQSEFQNIKTKFEQFISHEAYLEIERLKRKIQALKSANHTLLAELKEASIQSEGLKKEIHDLKETKLLVETKLTEKMLYIEEIHSTLGWKLLNYFRSRIKVKLFPSETKREVFYKLMIKGILSIQNRGLKGTIKRFREKIREKRAYRKISKENFFKPIFQDESFQIIDKKVSVVIPTKNAGHEFKITLHKIQNQKGLKELEIIVIDSGSTDETLNIANKNCLNILHINPEDFNHGNVRNLGAKHATGQYIIFMSQDVFPITDYCISKILKVLERDDTIAAATVKQIPRSDSDLFSCWQLWYYYNKLLLWSADRVVSINKEAFAKMPADQKRRLSQLDNVFCCYKKDIFDKFGFSSLPYAEDLDIGIRLVSEGYKLAFFDSVGVVHSHNRSASYYFKRSYIDTLSILRLLNQEPIKWDDFNIKSTQDILSQIYALYLKVNYITASINNGRFKGAANDFYDFVKNSMYQHNISFTGNKDLETLISKINVTVKNVFANDIRVNEIFLNLYLNTFKSFTEFLTLTTNDSDNREEIIGAIYKLFAVIGGSILANYLIYIENNEILDDSLQTVTEFLKEGI